ncbi:sigma 54-interacting transcriptional regulator [Vagococcus entomophilus]|uniref:DNA translocase FtsK n=1 Tax=Vagococcus entomophilus TaxID=1160095 RepID=A0A430AJG7_9ENTE|nr:sigma 54-interacting transcriptional regulator [Vagococcus entomophilus]RSU08256.1 hypothetical protein CBF30_03170 [Vagococcus entomophilus]
MKKAKYFVLDCLKELVLSDKKLITTQNIADKADLSRGVTSLYLSQLLEEHLVMKEGTKPVYWSVSDPKDAFCKFIGYQGSLNKIIEACKTSVIYPPHGFPIMITGPSGVGKSFLASLLYEYALEKQCIEKESSFITLNCADYANNLELLSSVLFGYKKGAFTGALEDTDGLVDQADGGYLFLDEIHRLPKESQEKLFTLLDTGQFYPLGEKEKPKKVKIHFVFATTESLDHYLLQTFRRRVPMNVELPAYDKRPLSERYQLLYHSYLIEAKRMNRKIKVGTDSVTNLLFEKFEGNIGTLQNQVKISCAKAYNQQKDAETIVISNKHSLDSYIEIDPSKAFDAPFMLPTESYASNCLTFARSIEENEQSMVHFSDQQFEIQKMIRMMKENISQVYLDSGYLNLTLSKMNQYLTNIIQQKYGVKIGWDDKSLQDLAIIYQFFLELPNTFQTSAFRLGKRVQQKYPRSYDLFYPFVAYIFKETQVTKEFISWLTGITVYTLPSNDCKKIESIDFVCILVSHGASMATSIQEVVNNLCGNYLFEAFDMPIDTSMKEISTEINSYLQRIGKKNSGVILLFDMGSLSEMYKEIKPSIESDLLVINNLTTAIALDVGLEVQQNYSFKKIAQKAEGYSQLTKAQYYEGISQNKNIIVSCMSGVGLSEEIKRIMQKSLKKETEIITMDYKDLKYLLETQEDDYFDKTKFILTTTDLQQTGQTTVLNIYDIMEKKGAEELQQLLLENGENTASIKEMMEDMLQFFTIEGISNRLQFLNPQIVIKEVQTIIDKYEQYYQWAFDGKIKLNLYMHIALMIERMLISPRKLAPLPKADQPLHPEKAEFFSVSKNIFHGIELKYNLIIDDYELSLMYELLKSRI